MAEQEMVEIYLCPNCLSADGSGGPCPKCGLERLHCRPGEADDPCRRPLMDAQGRLRTRAPLWWLRLTAPDVARHHEDPKKRK
jgi:hypothetical protein